MGAVHTKRLDDTYKIRNDIIRYFMEIIPNSAAEIITALIRREIILSELVKDYLHKYIDIYPELVTEYIGYDFTHIYGDYVNAVIEDIKNGRIYELYDRDVKQKLPQAFNATYKLYDTDMKKNILEILSDIDKHFFKHYFIKDHSIITFMAPFPIWGLFSVSTQYIDIIKTLYVRRLRECTFGLMDYEFAENPLQEDTRESLENRLDIANVYSDIAKFISNDWTIQKYPADYILYTYSNVYHNIIDVPDVKPLQQYINTLFRENKERYKKYLNESGRLHPVYDIKIPHEEFEQMFILYVMCVLNSFNLTTGCAREYMNHPESIETGYYAYIEKKCIHPPTGKEISSSSDMPFNAYSNIEDDWEFDQPSEAPLINVLHRDSNIEYETNGVYFMLSMMIMYVVYVLLGIIFSISSYRSYQTTDHRKYSSRPTMIFGH